jgi:hypothetical protein
LKTLRPKLDTKKVQIEKAKISYHHAKKVVVHKMKLLKVATKMKIKVDASVTKAIQQTSSVIKKPVVVNKATIKISTKIKGSSVEAKILAHNKKLIKQIRHKKHKHKVTHHKKKRAHHKKTHHISKKAHKKVILHIKKSITKQIVKNNTKIAKLQSVIKHTKKKAVIAKAKKSLKVLKAVALTLKVTKQAVKRPTHVLKASKTELKKHIKH